MTPAGVGYGVGAALSWGVSDFSGGLASRRAAPLATVVVSQSVALVAALAVLLVTGERYPGSGPIAWAVVAGVAVFASFSCFYRALAAGAMGLVAAVTGVVGAGLPVLVGAITGDRLRPTDAAGIVLALLAVVIVARPAGDAGIGRRTLGFALLAGIAAGVFFLSMGQSASAGGETWWPIATSRVIAVILAGGTTVALGLTQPTIRAASPLMAVVGLADLGGVACFVVAAAQGALGVAAVVSSQYPAVTAVLAWAILKERLAPAHILGIVLALVAIALIALP
jgi:drug/metabolite transporter (DMT)-like permease